MQKLSAWPPKESMSVLLRALCSSKTKASFTDFNHWGFLKVEKKHSASTRTEPAALGHCCFSYF